MIAGFIFGGALKARGRRRHGAMDGTGGLVSAAGRAHLIPRPPKSPEGRSCRADLKLKALFLDRELGQLGALHEFDDLLDLFEVQKVPWL